MLNKNIISSQTRRTRQSDNSYFDSRSKCHVFGVHSVIKKSLLALVGFYAVLLLPATVMGSPPPPPQYPIRIDDMCYPVFSGLHAGYKVRTKITIAGDVVYDHTTADGRDWRMTQTSKVYPQTGTPFTMELWLLDPNGNVVTQGSASGTTKFTGSSYGRVIGVDNFRRTVPTMDFYVQRMSDSGGSSGYWLLGVCGRVLQ